MQTVVGLQGLLTQAVLAESAEQRLGAWIQRRLDGGCDRGGRLG